MEKALQELFWVHFFGRSYLSNGTIIRLDAGLINKRSSYIFCSKDLMNKTQLEVL